MQKMSRFTLLLSLFILAHCSNSEETSDNDIYVKCSAKSHSSCHSCLHVHPQCIWINQKDTNMVDRCTIISKLPDGKRFEYISSTNSTLEIIDNEDFRLPSSRDEAAIQIRPQTIRIALRYKDTVTFKLKYKALPDYPLDIYVLLDQTYSMAKQKEYIKELGDKLTNFLGTLTQNFRVAFGYFSDKVAMPYFQMTERVLANPCYGIDEFDTCVLGSNFVHVLNFTSDIESFIQAVDKLNMTANMDDLEGGLDALMQVILCQDEFGWQKHTRKIIMIATDGYLHTAGEGLLGGIIRRMPNYSCQMKYKEERWTYDGLQYDYPSVEEVHQQLKEKKMLLLLAIQEKNDGLGSNQRYYKALNNLIPSVSYFAMLNNATQNITDTLSAGYMDVVKQVLFKPVKLPPWLKLSSQVKCMDLEFNTTFGCYDVQMGKEYEFEMKLALTGIPPHVSDTFHLEETHIHETVQIQVNYVDFCNCSDDNTFMGHGQYHCGLLICDKGWIGKNCSHKCTREIGRYKNDSYISSTCSNRGDFDETTCECICDPDSSGKFCEFPQCPHNNEGEICSEHGTCEGGECKCIDGYTEDNCQCSTDVDSCKAPGEPTICSSHGRCECGKCVCVDNAVNNIKYFGKYCESCTGCHSCMYAEVLEHYIRGDWNNSDLRKFKFVEDVNANLPDLECRVMLSDSYAESCRILYKIDASETILLTFYKQCTNYATITGIIVIPILICSMAVFVVWKIVVVVQDKRAVAQFQKRERENAAFQSNALFQPPVTKYSNPMYSKND